MVLFFDPHLITHQSNIGALLRKVTKQHTRTLSKRTHSGKGGLTIMYARGTCHGLITNNILLA